MEKSAPARPAANLWLPSYFFTLYGIVLLTILLFLARVPQWDVATFSFIISVVLLYPLLYLLPGMLLVTIVAAICTHGEAKHPVLRRSILTGVTFLAFFPVHLFLLLDAGLYYRYNYHINPHVINIFTTPGGFASMGLRQAEFFSFAAAILLLALFHAFLIFCFSRFSKICKIGPVVWSNGWKTRILTVLPIALGGLLFLFSFLSYTYAQFTMRSNPLLAADAIPLFIKGRSEDLYLALGVKRPDRDAFRVRMKNNVHLKNYPAKKIVRAPHEKYNIIWIACESWAAKLYSPEIMPETAKFAQKGVTFTKHYSGGNLTRQGMFSMFYGLPANYWHPFLAARRGPLFIDWLLEDGYRCNCITSTTFTYPEFDQTVFYKIPSQDLFADSKGKSWERDRRNVQRLVKTISDGAKSGQPFFTFMFFESTHNPYVVPPDARVFNDYMEPFNAAMVKASDGSAIFRRAANCARNLDMCFAQIFRTLEEKDLLKNTIVVIAGDHGEEFLERNYLGHGSQFNNEQTHTTLILYYPGITPGIYSDISSHLDIVPMISKMLGVQNPPQDYSCGMDLLSAEKPHRRYALIADWDKVFFAGEKYKSIIPLTAIDYAKQVITDANDNPLADAAPFYQEYNADLMQVQKDLTRFTAPAENDGGNTGSRVAVYVILAVLILGIAWWLFKAKAPSGK